MSTLFITGVSGFAGTNLARYFIKQGIAVVGHSRDAQTTRMKFRSTPFPVLDKCSAEILDDFKVDTIIHLAGIAHDLSNAYSDEDYSRINYENTRKIYNDFLGSSATKFIYLSSIKAAVDISPSFADEEVVPHPVTAYGRSKLRAEEFIRSVRLPADKSYYIFRPCMIHGPENKGNLNLLYRYVRGGLPWFLGAYDNRRCFLNIENFNFIVHQFHQRDLPQGVYNLADDGDLSTNELIKVISDAMNKRTVILRLAKPLVTFVVRVLGQQHKLQKLTEDLLVSNKKLITALEKPLPVPIAEGIRRTIRSFS